MKIDSSGMVSIHPYFRAQAGKMPQIKPLLAAMVAKTKSEPDNLFYDFTIHGDDIFCREGYTGGAGAVAHVGNVGPLIEQMLQFATVARLELHGPAAELDELKKALAGLNPVCFLRENI